MKPVFIACFLLGLIPITAWANPQNTKLSINMNNITLSELFDVIKKQTSYSFWYDVNDVNDSKAISVNANDRTVKEIIETALDNSGLEVSVTGNHIVISKRSTSNSTQQDKQIIRGKVLDSLGAVIGATVMEDGTNNATGTDVDGNFSLSISNAAKTISVSFLGYKTQTVNLVTGKTEYTIILEEDSQVLDEVLVVAFGTVKKEAFTGSAGVMNTNDILQSQQTNAAQALAGRVAGVQISNSTGEMGSQPSITVRGIGSINAGNDPLFIVDGMPYDGDIGNINPTDIESMTVLKDAASNALYGARGANGVIMITTKRSEYNRTNITLDTKWGFSQSARVKYDLITDPGQYYEAYYKARYNKYIFDGETDVSANAKANADIMNPMSGNGPGYLVFTVPSGENLIGMDGHLNPGATSGNLFTDTSSGKQYWLQADNWEDEALRNGFFQEYNAALSTGNESSNTYLSLGYLTKDGITPGSDMQRITGRLKSDFKLKEWLNVGGNVGFTNYKYNKLTFGDDVIGTGNIWSIIDGQAPIYPVYLRDANKQILRDDQGRIRYDFADSRTGISGVSRGGGSGGNAVFANENRVNESKGNAVTASAFADFRFLNDFKFTVNVNASNDEKRRHNYESAYVQSFGTANTNGYVYQSQERTFSYNLQQLLNYTKTINNVHNINALLGHEYYNTQYSYVSGSKTNVAFEGNQSLNGAVTMSGLPSSMSSRYNIEGYFFRGMYDYNNKYFASISFRRDASSNFHPDNRWGNFWSIGGAWIVDRESWYNIGWLNELKVKASVGSQGNDNIGSYLYDDQFSIAANGNDDVSLSFKQKGNKNITWETNTNYNAGVEFSAFNKRVSGSIDYYYRLTSDMLYKFTVAPSNGYTSYWDNIGDMRNMGFEVDLNIGLIRNKDINWDFNLNLSTISNKIIKLPKEKQTITSGKYSGYVDDDTHFVSLYRYFIGEDLPLYSWYIPEYAGVNESGEAMWYKDVIDADGNVIDKTTTLKSSEATDYIQGSALPDLYGGFGTTFTYRDFDLSANFNYQIGGEMYDYGYASRLSAPSAQSSGNFHKDIYKSWSAENSGSSIPRFKAGETNGQNARSSRFLTSASYLNFQNISVGYSLPKNLLQKMNIQRLRLYVQCDNIAYISARKGFDPRQSSKGRVHPQAYSPVRTFTMGLNLSF